MDSVLPEPEPRRGLDPAPSESVGISGPEGERWFPAERRRFLEALARGRGIVGQVPYSYLTGSWFDDEAIAWASHGLDAADATAWKELGLTPVEAERQQAQGNGAVQTAKAWERAGLPVAEVADWLGAGLTPEEAAEQRARDVTAEQAAVLRSLRR